MQIGKDIYRVSQYVQTRKGRFYIKKNKWKMKNRIFLLDVFVFELKSLSTKFIREFDKF